MEAVLSKLHCRAVHMLSREKSATDFDESYVCDFKADDKTDDRADNKADDKADDKTDDKADGGSFLEDADSTAAMLGESCGNYSRSTSEGVKVIENNALDSSDAVDDLASPEASGATIAREDGTGFKEVGGQSVTEPTVTEPLAEIQESKPEEKKKFGCDKSTSNQPTADTNRLSRRKPQKTHRILETEETGSAIFHQYLDEDLHDYLSTRSHFTELQPEFRSGSTFSSSETGSKIDNDNPYADEDNIVLPEGTVLVQPEAADSSPQYLETDSSRSKKLFRGNLDSAIIHCTACNRQIGLDGFLDIHRHPVLKVLICRKCYSLYNDLEMEQDAEGSDEQCRWCGQGGDLICCDFCHNALCKGCIRRNLGRKELGSILSADEDVKWKCYVCDPKPLLNLIEHCTSVMEALTKQEKRQQELENRRKRADARPKAAGNSAVSGSENLIHGQPVSVIRAPSVSVMGRSLLKQIGTKAESRQKPNAVDVGGRTRDVSAFSASVNTARSAARTAPNKNGTIFVALPPPSGAGNLRGLSEVGSKVSLLPVNDRSLVQTLDRLLSATHSMSMFLASLKDDLRRICGTSVVFNTTQMQRRREVASKLWRAYNSYNKSLKEGTIQTGEIVRRTNSAAKVLLKTKSSGFQGKAEVIELSDSDEDADKAGQMVASLQRVVVDTDSKASVAQSVAVSDVAQRDESAPSDEIKRSVVVNRRKRKQPQHFVSVEEVPEKKSRVDEDSEDGERGVAQSRGAEEVGELKGDESKPETTTEIRGGVLCVEIGDDLEEVMHKIANGSCSSIELSTKQATNTEVRKSSEKSGAVDAKVGDSRAASELNGHTSLDSSYRSC